MDYASPPPSFPAKQQRRAPLSLKNTQSHCHKNEKIKQGTVKGLHYKSMLTISIFSERLCLLMLGTCFSIQHSKTEQLDLLSVTRKSITPAPLPMFTLTPRIAKQSSTNTNTVVSARLTGKRWWKMKVKGVNNHTWTTQYRRLHEPAIGRGEVWQVHADCHEHLLHAGVGHIAIVCCLVPADVRKAHCHWHVRRIACKLPTQDAC